VERDPCPAVLVLAKDADDGEFFPGDSLLGDNPSVTETPGDEPPVMQGTQDRVAETLPGIPYLQDSRVFERDDILFPDDLMQDAGRGEPVLVQVREDCPESFRERLPAPGS